MPKKEVAILDIGSSKLTMLVGSRGLNNTFVVRYEKEIPFTVYYDRSIIDETRFLSEFQNAVLDAESIIKRKINTLHVGVPAEFVTVFCKLSETTFTKTRKVDDRDIEELFSSCIKNDREKYQIINQSAVYFMLSDGRRTLEPKGVVSDKLGGLLSFFACKAGFKKLVDGACKALNIKNVEYSSATLAECMYLFDESERDGKLVFIDCGYLSTSFSYVLGDGILFQRCCSVGGGVISGKLAEAFSCDADIAERLKRQINLTYQPYREALYEFSVGGMDYEFPVERVNKITVEVLDLLAEKIVKFIEEGVYEKVGLKLYLTGGGISYIRGAKEYLTQKLQYIIQVVKPNVPKEDKPSNSSVLSLLELALNNDNERRNIFDLFKKR